ncbi:Unknown protein sequence [Pseudomonas syringae pv. syringae]|nr:Unknown protein sequence [Pseudomonas syringae pv. syringae]
MTMKRRFSLLAPLSSRMQVSHYAENLKLFMHQVVVRN